MQSPPIEIPLGSFPSVTYVVPMPMKLDPLHIALFVALALIVGWTGDLRAQMQMGTVQGFVLGVRNAPAPNATVKLLGAGRVARTDDQGDFRFTSVSPGTYEIEVTIDSLGISVRSDDVVASGDCLTTVVVQITADRRAFVRIDSERDRGSSGTVRVLSSFGR